MVKIDNVHLLEDVFGRFPSFHDAEVVSIALDRGRDSDPPTLQTQIHVFEMTSEVIDGKYILTNHTLVTFRFRGINGLELNGFNRQNVLNGLTINDISDQQLDGINFEISFDGIYGVDARFNCRAIEIASVEPFSK